MITKSLMERLRDNALAAYEGKDVPKPLGWEILKGTIYETNETHEFKGTKSELYEQIRQTLAKGEALVKAIKGSKP